MNEIALEVKNISKRFRLSENRSDSLKESVKSLFSTGAKPDVGFQALSNVSFEVKQGESLGIIGRNGAGKSTLLKILSGIMQPDEGEINFYGKTVSILDIGAGFHPELSGRENVFLSASLYNFSRKETEQKFQEIIDFSGVEEFIDQPVKNYSAGMYLRLAFSIITCLEADIYLLDEVINVGDANFQMKCKSKIEELISKGKTLLIASHNLNEISVLCNKIILLEKGKIIEPGENDVIQTYLTTVLPDFFALDNEVYYSVRTFQSLSTSHPNIAIIGYGIENYKNTKGGISNEHPFTAFAEFQWSGHVTLDVTMKFFDSTGVLVFYCSALQSGSHKFDSTGNYRVEFKIPSHLLNERIYIADLLLIDSDSKSPLQRIEKFLTVRVANEVDSVTGKKAMVLPGVVKPDVSCSVRKL